MDQPMPTDGEPKENAVPGQATPGAPASASRTGLPPVPDKHHGLAAKMDGQDGRPTPKPAAPAAPPPPPPPVPSALAHVRLPFEGVDHGFRGVNAEARVSPERVVEAASLLDDEGFSLDTITG